MCDSGISLRVCPTMHLSEETAPVLSENEDVRPMTKTSSGYLKRSIPRLLQITLDEVSGLANAESHSDLVMINNNVSLSSSDAYHLQTVTSSSDHRICLAFHNQLHQFSLLFSKYISSAFVSHVSISNLRLDCSCQYSDSSFNLSFRQIRSGLVLPFCRRQRTW
jgi:hypothetical protein